MTPVGPSYIYFTKQMLKYLFFISFCKVLYDLTDIVK